MKGPGCNSLSISLEIKLGSPLPHRAILLERVHTSTLKNCLNQCTRLASLDLNCKLLNVRSLRKLHRKAIYQSALRLTVGAFYVRDKLADFRDEWSTSSDCARTRILVARTLNRGEFMFYRLFNPLWLRARYENDTEDNNDASG